MAIKAYFSENQHAITVSGLYQWDLGQTLEIQCTELGSELMEVHFACDRMSEAIVRPCTFSNGVGTVTIPNQCLEQTGTITAWIYSIVKAVAGDGTETITQGHTVKTITLAIIERTRPSVLREPPPEYVDTYKEAIAAINAAVEDFESGNVTAKRAISATQATQAIYATSAGNLILSKDALTVDLEVNEYLDYSIEGSKINPGLYLAILTLPNEVGNDVCYTGVGYIGSANNGNEWNHYQIALGNKFIHVVDRGDSFYRIGINTEGNKGGETGSAGTLKLYRVAGFTEV